MYAEIIVAEMVNHKENPNPLLSSIDHHQPISKPTAANAYYTLKSAGAIILGKSIIFSKRHRW
jgi:hypothetical protein